jgi:hypothetical protein
MGNWTELAQDTVKWRDFVNTVLNFLLPHPKKRNFLMGHVTDKFKGRTCIMKLGYSLS